MRIPRLPQLTIPPVSVAIPQLPNISFSAAIQSAINAYVRSGYVTSVYEMPIIREVGIYLLYEYHTKNQTDIWCLSSSSVPTILNRLLPADCTETQIARWLAMA